MKKHTGAYLEGCIASELNPGCRVGVGSKFACVLCQQPPAGVIHDVIVVRPGGSGGGGLRCAEPAYFSRIDAKR